jgi:hypothetical protein
MAETAITDSDNGVHPVPGSRFSWSMRLFLTLVVFNMVFRNVSALAPWLDWCKDLEMRRLPLRLSTLDEYAKMEPTEKNPHPAYEDVMETCDAFWEYWRPWPGKATRPLLKSWVDWGKYTLCWINGRYCFFENIAGIGQEWPMFSDVPKSRTYTRAELVFADGSKRIARQESDPEDLTCYGHWFKQKIRYYELQVGESAEACCLGWCNLLAHRYAENSDGAALVSIRLFPIWYKSVPADEDVDPVEFLQSQTGPPPAQVGSSFFEYDVATRKGRKTRST